MLGSLTQEDGKIPKKYFWRFMNFLLIFSMFIIPLAWTPGPVNITLSAVGIQSGFRRSIPLIAGINIAFLAQALGVGIGLKSLFAAYPLFLEVIRYLGILYLLFLAWKIAKMKFGEGAVALGFWNGFALSMLNPKVWMTLIVMYAQLSEEGQTLSGIVLLSALALGYFLVGNTAWAIFGASLRRWVENERFFFIQKIVFSLLLVGVAVYMLFA